MLRPTCDLVFQLQLKQMKTNMLATRIDEILRVVRLEDKADSLSATLSGGMKKRLSVAIATISKPKVYCRSSSGTLAGTRVIPELSLTPNFQDALNDYN